MGWNGADLEKVNSQLEEITNFGEITKTRTVSQATYDALVTKDPHTEYIIMPDEYFEQ